MGVRHITSLVRFIQAEAKGSLYITVNEPAYEAEIREPQRTYSLRRRKDGEQLASAKVQTLPGCCGVVLVRNFNGPTEWVAKLIEIVEKGAARARYGALILTLRSESPIIPLLGGTVVTGFRNGKTDHMVSVITKVIPQEPRAVNVVEGE